MPPLLHIREEGQVCLTNGQLLDHLNTTSAQHRPEQLCLGHEHYKRHTVQHYAMETNDPKAKWIKVSDEL